MIIKQFSAMFHARTMEFIRDRGTFFWNLLFPIFLVLGFSFAFSNQNQALFKVALLDQTLASSDSRLGDFISIPEIQFIPLDPQDPMAKEESLEKLRQHTYDLVIDPATSTYAINSLSKNAGLISRLFNNEVVGYSQTQVTGEPIRYVDWLVPGIIGMNMMFSCLFGVGYVLVRYRKNGVLKRMKATPVSALNFISAQAASRFIIVLATSIFVFLGTNIFLGFMMKGSWFDLILVASLGIFSMISIGLLFATRFKSEELAGGILNIVTFPMLILSGVFVSLEGSPEILQGVAQVLPLTHFVEATRAIMLEGADLLAILPHLLVLVGFSIVSLIGAAFLFKWE